MILIYSKYNLIDWVLKPLKCSFKSVLLALFDGALKVKNMCI